MGGLRGHHDDPRVVATEKADVFGLAVVLWELMTAAVPFAGMNSMAIGFALVQGQRPPFPQACPPHLKALVASMWDADVARRPTAAEALGAVMALGESKR